MDPVQLTPAVWQLPFPVGHVHLVRLPDGHALVDTGLPGSGAAVLGALARLGVGPRDVTHLVLTHAHVDHTGSAAELAAATGARVLAGAGDAAVVRGAASAPAAVLSASEQALHEQVMGGGEPAAPEPVEVDAELREGDVLDGWGEPVRVLHVPGHTPGSIALHLPASGVLFPGDVVGTGEGRAVLGPFNADRDQAIGSFRRLAALDHVRTLCVPHGDPVLSDAGDVLRAATPERDWL